MRYFYAIFILFCFKAEAQKLAPNFFSTTSSYYPYQTQTQSIVKFFDNYIVSHNLIRIDTIPFLNLELYDANFSLIKSKHLKLLPSDGFLFFGFNPINVNNNDSSAYVFATMRHNWTTNNLYNGVIFKLDKNLDTLWHKEYFNLGDSSLYLTGAIKQNDGFLVYGSSSLQDKGDPFILKIDFDGNELWRRTYHNPWITSSFYKFIPTKNKGFAGIEYCPDHPTDGFSDIRVSYYDSLYNVKWSNIYYTSFPDLIGDFIETSDSNLVYTGGLCTSQTFPPTGALFTRQYIQKMDKNNGNIIWQKSYANRRFELQLWGIYESSSKKLYSVGTAVRPNASKPGGNVASMLVTNQYGDSLNYQESFHDTVSTYTQLYNLIPITNGFASVGHTSLGVYTGTTLTTYDQSNWLIKADTNGCFMQLCADGFDTRVDEVNNFAVEAFSIYPNPASSIVNFQLPSNAINNNYVLVIYDSNGKQVYRHLVNQKTVSLDVAAFSAGLYFAVVSENEVIKFKKKFIIN